MSRLRVFDSKLIKGEKVVAFQWRPLWDAINIARKNGCNVLIHTYTGWECRKVDFDESLVVPGNATSYLILPDSPQI